MNTIKKIFLVFVFFSMSGNKIQAQCNASNSPTFQIITSQATLATNGVCGMQITIINAATNPTPGGVLSFALMAPGQSGTIIPGPMLPIVTVPGIYTVIVADPINYCITSQTVQVTVLSAPIISIAAGNTLVCSGQAATLTASGASTYSWNTNEMTSSISVTPTANSTYSVTGTGTNACANTAYVVIHVNPLPNVAITADQNSVCVSESVTLTTSGANTYTWSTNQTGASITVTPAVTTTYSVQGTDNHDCEAGKQITVYVSSCTGVEEFKNEAMTIYPNPANDRLMIKSITEKEDLIIHICDVTGRIVLLKQIKTENFMSGVDLDLPDGAYIATVANGQNQVITKRLLIAK